MYTSLEVVTTCIASLYKPPRNFFSHSMIARKSALIIFIQLLNGLLGYIALKFIALYMDPWEYGVVGFAYGFVALFSMFGTLGFDHAHIKRISEGKDLGTCIATFAVTKLFLAGLLASVVIGSVAIWKYILGRGFESPLHEQAIYILLAYFVLLTLTQTFISTFNARKESAKAQIPLLAYTLTRVVATIYVAYNDLGPIALASTYLIGEIFHFLLALSFFRGYPVARPSLAYFKNYLSFAIHMAFAVFSWRIMTNIDKVFIQLFWSANEVGEYFAVYNLSRFVILFSTSVGLLLLPTVSEYHSKRDFRKVREVVAKSERYLSMIVFPIIVLIIVLAEPIIHILLSDKYMDALLILRILPIFALIEILSRPYQSLTQGMGMPEFARNRVLIMVGLNIILDIILIPRNIRSLGLKLFGLSAEGAAIATVISYFAGFVYIRYVAYKISGIGSSRAVLKHAISSLVMAFMMYKFMELYDILRWYDLLLAFIFGAGIYLSILYLIGELKKDDIHLFIDSLNPLKMLRYMKEEMLKR